jgi:hypothetical protein
VRGIFAPSPAYEAAMRAYSVCTSCSTVHVTGEACPGCAGTADPLEAVRAAVGSEPPIPLRVTVGRAPLLGLMLGLGAFVTMVLLAWMVST